MLYQLFEDPQQQTGTELRRGREADHAPQRQQAEECGQVEIQKDQRKTVQRKQHDCLWKLGKAERDGVFQRPCDAVLIVCLNGKEKLQCRQIKKQDAQKDQLHDMLEREVSLRQKSEIYKDHERSRQHDQPFDGCLFEIRPQRAEKAARCAVKCPQKVRQYLKFKLFKQPKGLAACESQAAGPFGFALIRRLS